MSADNFLKTAIGIAALGVGYYYGLHLPQRDAEAKAAAATAASEIQESKRRRKEEFEFCKADAFESYSNRWDASCASLNESETKARKSCEEAGYTQDYCSRAFPVRPAKDCTLPREILGQL